MTPQGFLTAGVVLLTIVITMALFYVTVAKTPKHGFICLKCGKETPPNASRCPSCSADIANADQII
jgi:ribosomal protein L40E